MRTVIVYDRVNKWGGAERLLLSLNKIFPEAPLYTSVYSPDSAKWAKAFPKVSPSFLQKIPGALNNHDKLALLMPLAFESFDFREFDLVISVTSEAAKGIITRPETRHLCICLTPTRYLWSGYDDYFNTLMKKSVSKIAVDYLRNWDKVAAQRPDTMIAISKEVQKRIKKYYGRESEVIYPPAGELKTNNLKLKINTHDYFLIVSRLVSYKRVDLAIKVFNELDLPLVIVGTGSEERKLRQMSKKNIIFTGRLTESELANYYYRSKALVFPQKEDLGLVSLEAQNFGKPVIAFYGGGAKETVINNKTGVFFYTQSVSELKNALKKFSGMKFSEKIIKKNSARFSEKRFKIELLKRIKNV
ncbi:MAG: putative glycosyltransferase [Candidatus Woesebacteria bacterium GW2011_GWB1_43_14]|uniref:Putative glycosyltransferase n=1 Tax=Candidatus Woesebacteria bacterium GW2011_GWB1_43_14 TaxID=1618578 RepID=A0A0G1DHL7_9BACT|nr:MAG: putative glycosyltransferase [Candidatus Woesebacteria bacterium GW2011_GWA1_39_11b]KKS78409.1 MAG: putative glycosyltransferase [Candidatus Woesebacteria bacterium GW2011_GWC1_42_9]KKS97174.1 MAG: putative glycosyltransferase [Candidatus Woesebacteria bacterium GW2011_GWB1_43_14]